MKIIDKTSPPFHIVMLINCTGDVKFKLIKLQCGFNQVMAQNQTIIENTKDEQKNNLPSYQQSLPRT
jgi:hypothetical protein